VGVTRPMLRGVRRGGELHENGALDDVRAGQAGRGRRTSRSAAASAGPWEVLLNHRHPRTRRVTASEGAYPSTADHKGKSKEATHSLPPSTYSAPGA
jgi:hypothetical protein